MKKVFGIVGNPVKHSLSPVLHNYWFRKYKIDAVYSLLNIQDKELGEVIKKITLGRLETSVDFKPQLKKEE